MSSRKSLLMKIFEWIRSIFAPRRIVRDVSTLTADVVGDDAATRQEAVASSNEPLKPGHRRRALRDPRLLPKPKPTARVWPRTKKQRILSRDEADRLFSTTLRTRDRA